MKIVISQPMFFPWVGLLEQINLADIFVHYDDVQFTRGFYNRVQIRTNNGIKWLTIPLRKHSQKTDIIDVEIDDSQDWRSEHLQLLENSYGKAPFFNEMLDLVERVYDKPAKVLSDISRASIMELANYFKLSNCCQFYDASKLNIPGKSSQRLHDITKSFRGSIYITGHGASNYLDHELFNSSKIQVEYMKYLLTPYSQIHGDFTPYVSALDLVANCGEEGGKVIKSETIGWKEFTNERN